MFEDVVAQDDVELPSSNGRELISAAVTSDERG